MGGRGSGSGMTARTKGNVERVRQAASKIPVLGSGGPALVGTEKQVAWANDIRADMISRINEEVRRQAAMSISATEERQRTADTGIGRRGRKLSGEALERARKGAASFADAQVEGFKDAASDISDVKRLIHNATSAKFYIDNRRDFYSLKNTAFRARVYFPA